MSAWHYEHITKDEVVEEIEIFYRTNPGNRIAEDLGIKPHTISGIAHRMGIKKLGRLHKVYTEEEDQFIIENFRRLGNKEMSEVLNRTLDSIKHRMKALGLKRTDRETRLLQGKARVKDISF